MGAAVDELIGSGVEDNVDRPEGANVVAIGNTALLDNLGAAGVVCGSCVVLDK